MRAMSDANIATRCGAMCDLRRTASAATPLRVRFPNSEPAQDQCIILPPYPQMMESEQEQAVTLFKQACAVR
jgi:perosamine synthetase